MMHMTCTGPDVHDMMYMTEMCTTYTGPVDLRLAARVLRHVHLEVVPERGLVGNLPQRAARLHAAHGAVAVAVAGGTGGAEQRRHRAGLHAGGEGRKVDRVAQPSERGEERLLSGPLREEVVVGEGERRGTELGPAGDRVAPACSGY